jgi:hypothetical protein
VEHRESASSFVTNPYAPLSDSIVLLLNPYGDPNQPLSGSRYSFNSATNEPPEFIRQDVHPLSTDQTTPGSVPKSQSKRDGPQPQVPTRSRTDVSTNPRRPPARRSVCDAVRDISGDTLLGSRLGAEPDDLQIQRMQASFVEPDPTALYPKRSDTKFEGQVSSPLESIKNLLFDLKGLPDERNPFAAASQGECGKKTEQSDAVLKTGLSKRPTFRIVDFGEQVRSSYAPQHAHVEGAPSRHGSSVAKSPRTTSPLDAIRHTTSQ